MTFNKDNTIALTGTILIHLIILFLLMYFGLERTKPVGEEGLFVNFGNIEEASGTFEPAGEEAVETESTPPVVPLKAEKPEELISQDMEKSISLADQKKKRELETKRIEEDRIRQEQERKAAEIRKKTASVFSKTPGQTLSQGTSSSGEGNQGSIVGDISSANTKGGGQGYGNFSLSGRSINGSLPLPVYSIQEEGIVVVQITVNPKGNVVSASISLQGTNTDNSALRSSALNAAKQAKFNTIQGNQNQSGTITYQYRLR